MPLTNYKSPSAKNRWHRTILIVLASTCLISGPLPIAASAAKNTTRNIDFPFNLPSRLGKIIDSYQAQGAGDPDKPFVIHIQDAHAHPEAQEKIREILEYLSTVQKVPGTFWFDIRVGTKLLVALEGAKGEIHPEYLNFFAKHPLANEAIIADLFRKGVLTGAERFAWEEFQRRRQGSSPQEIFFWGAEDPSIYRENLAIFKDHLAHRKRIEQYFAELFKEGNKLRSRIRSPRLKKFLSEETKYCGDFQNGQPLAFEPCLDFIKRESLAVLATDLEDSFEQLRFPNLVRVFALRRRLPPDPVPHFELKNPLETEIEAAGLFKEIGTLHRLLLRKFAVESNDRRILHFKQDLKTLHRLLSLDIFSDQYRNLLKCIDRLSPRFLLQRSTEWKLAKPEEGWTSSPFFSLQPYFDSAIKFYGLALRRDRVLLENTLQKLASLDPLSHDEPAIGVLITGGFHTPGLSRLMKQRGISYVVIQPSFENHEASSVEAVFSDAPCKKLSDRRKTTLSKRDCLFLRSLLGAGQNALQKEYGLSYAESRALLREAVRSDAAFQGSRLSPLISRHAVSEALILSEPYLGFRSQHPLRSELRQTSKFEYEDAYVRASLIPEGRQEVAFALRLAKNPVDPERFQEFQSSLFSAVGKAAKKIYSPLFPALRVAVIGRYSDKKSFELLGPAVINQIGQAARESLREKYPAFKLKVTHAKRTDDGSIVFYVEDKDPQTRNLLGLRYRLHQAMSEAMTAEAKESGRPHPEDFMDQFRMPREPDDSVSPRAVITLARLIPDKDHPEKFFAGKEDLDHLDHAISEINENLAKHPLYLPIDTVSLLTPAREFLEDLQSHEEQLIPLKKIEPLSPDTPKVAALFQQITSLVETAAPKDFNEIFASLHPEGREEILLALKKRLDDQSREWRISEGNFVTPYWQRLWWSARLQAILWLIHEEYLHLTKEAEENKKQASLLLADSKKEYFFATGAILPFQTSQDPKAQLQKVVDVFGREHGLRIRTYMALPPNSGYEGSGTLAAAIIETLLVYFKKGSRGSVEGTSSLRIQATSSGGGDNADNSYRYGMAMQHGAFYLKGDQPPVVVRVEEIPEMQLEFESVDLGQKEIYRLDGSEAFQIQGPLKYLKGALVFAASLAPDQPGDPYAIAKLATVFEGLPEIGVFGGVNNIATILGGLRFTTNEPGTYDFISRAFSKKTLKEFQNHAVLLDPGITKRETGRISTTGRQASRTLYLLLNRPDTLAIMADLRKTTFEIRQMTYARDYRRLAGAINNVQHWTELAVGGESSEAIKILKDFLGKVANTYRKWTGETLGSVVQGSGPVGGIGFFGEHKGAIERSIKKHLGEYRDDLAAAGLLRHEPSLIPFEMTSRPMTTYERLWHDSINAISFKGLLDKRQPKKLEAYLVSLRKWLNAQGLRWISENKIPETANGLRETFQTWYTSQKKPSEIEFEVFRNGREMVFRLGNLDKNAPKKSAGYFIFEKVRRRSEMRVSSTRELRQRFLNPRRDPRKTSDFPRDLLQIWQDRLAQSAGIYPRQWRRKTTVSALILESRINTFIQEFLSKHLGPTPSAQPPTAKGGIIFEWSPTLSWKEQISFIKEISRTAPAQIKIVVLVTAQSLEAERTVWNLRQQFINSFITVSLQPIGSVRRDMIRSLRVKSENVVSITGVGDLLQEKDHTLWGGRVLKELSPFLPGRLFVFLVRSESESISVKEVALTPLLFKLRSSLLSETSA